MGSSSNYRSGSGSGHAAVTDLRRYRIPKSLGYRYRIGDRLGGGTLADVYRAYDREREELVAIKIFAGEETHGPEAQRFLREIETAAALEHPNILPVHASGEADRRLYYVMPLMIEGSLRDRLRARGAMRTSETLRLLRQVTDALAFTHARGIVHRDIKPDNVLVHGDIALVTDFGVAKLLRAARKISAAGQPVGTPAYMAPEQVLAQETIDHRADIYAVGVVAYEMITGSQPFLRNTAEAVMTAQLYAPPPNIRHHDRRIPRRAARIITKCLAKNREERWPDAQTLLSAIDGYLAWRMSRWRRRRSSGRVVSRES